MSGGKWNAESLGPQPSIPHTVSACGHQPCMFECLRLPPVSPHPGGRPTRLSVQNPSHPGKPQPLHSKLIVSLAPLACDHDPSLTSHPPQFRTNLQPTPSAPHPLPLLDCTCSFCTWDTCRFSASCSRCTQAASSCRTVAVSWLAAASRASC